MKQNKLFNRTRWRLAGWYTSVMSVILGICGFGLYEAIAHAHRVTLDRELISISQTLHNSIEPTLTQPGRLSPAAERFLLNICLTAAQQCLDRTISNHHASDAMHRSDYYIQFFNNSRELVAAAGLPPQPQKRYQQTSLALHTQDNQPWGYIQVGRSPQDFAEYMAAVRLIVLVGLPLAMLLVGIASWWLAGKAMQPIYHSYRQMQQFTADAAHELRTPLAATQATIESALRTNDFKDANSRDILQVLERQTHRLSQLVQDLLLLSRMEQQTLLAVRQSCCLNDIINDIAEEFAALAIAANLTLITDILSTPIYVSGNEEQLYRLISNLVVNAIQYTPTGEIRLRLKQSDRFALIVVQDSGVGIADADRQRIFDRFYRVSSDRSRTNGGSGLGLSIAQAIAQAHGGNIHVYSQLRKGSTFTIVLPCLSSV